MTARMDERMEEICRRPLLVAAAPNGAYKTREDHAAIPLTAGQLADTAVEVLAAGARMLHLHVRAQDGRHTLDAAAYRAAIAAIRARVGRRLFIQCTSEAAGVYDAAGQRKAVRELAELAGESFGDDGAGGVDGVSLAVRELAGCDADARAAKALFHCLAGRALAQYILYEAADVARYAALRERGVIPAGRHSVLLVAGKRDDDGDKSTAVDKLHAMVAALPAEVPWMACAFGDDEFACLREAVTLGGQARVGFENTLRLRCGRPAKDNRELITQLIQHGNPRDRPLADRRQTRAALGGEL